MKNISILLFVFIAIVSCSSDENLESNINPYLLQKVIFYTGTPYEKQWNFNEQGLLTEVRKADGTLESDYFYDTNNNLISSHYYHYFNGIVIQTDTLNFGYTNNILSSYNGQPVTYNSNNNTFSLTLDYSNSEINQLVENTIHLTEDGLFRHKTETFIPFNIDYSYDFHIRTLGNTFLNGNIIEVSSEDVMFGLAYYAFDNKPNPFKNALKPILKVDFLKYTEEIMPLHTIPYVSPMFASNNNVVSSYASDGYDNEIETPSVFTYTYNELNYPKTMTSFVGTIYYYYQGDTIP